MRRPRIQLIQRDVCRLRLHEWRSTPELIKTGSRLINDPVFRQMIDLLRTESPANDQVPSMIPLEQRAILQARGEGYAICLNNLESLAVYQPPKEPLEATFEPPEDEKGP